MANYSDLAQMAASSAFIDRVSMGVVVFARSILNEDPSITSHQKRYSWAIGAYQNARVAATPLLPAIALDSFFASKDPISLDGISDAELQIAIETVINQTLQF